MEQSPYGEADNRSASQEILAFYVIPNVHYRVHKSQMNPIHTLTPISLRCIPILSSKLRLGSSNWRLPFGYTH
jgi:hypothetical protein